MNIKGSKYFLNNLGDCFGVKASSFTSLLVLSKSRKINFDVKCFYDHSWKSEE